MWPIQSVVVEKKPVPEAAWKGRPGHACGSALETNRVEGGASNECPSPDCLQSIGQYQGFDALAPDKSVLVNGNQPMPKADCAQRRASCKCSRGNHVTASAIPYVARFQLNFFETSAVGKRRCRNRLLRRPGLDPELPIVKKRTTFDNVVEPPQRIWSLSARCRARIDERQHQQ